MFRRIKRWFSRKKLSTDRVDKAREALSLEIQVENARQSGYNQGMIDGLAIARQQAISSLRRALEDDK